MGEPVKDEIARCLGWRIQAAETEGNTATPCTCTAEQEQVHVADWVLREAAQRLVKTPVARQPLYSAVTVLRLLDKLAAVEALADEIDAHTYTPNCTDDRCRECLTAEAIRSALRYPPGQAQG